MLRRKVTRSPSKSSPVRPHSWLPTFWYDCDFSRAIRRVMHPYIYCLVRFFFFYFDSTAFIAYWLDCVQKVRISELPTQRQRCLCWFMLNKWGVYIIFIFMLQCLTLVGRKWPVGSGSEISVSWEHFELPCLHSVNFAVLCRCEARCCRTESRMSAQDANDLSIDGDDGLANLWSFFWRMRNYLVVKRFTLTMKNPNELCYLCHDIMAL
jgi:hypothetical protein